jgi:hypothetical protein
MLCSDISTSNPPICMTSQPVCYLGASSNPSPAGSLPSCKLSCHIDPLASLHQLLCFHARCSWPKNLARATRWGKFPVLKGNAELLVYLVCLEELYIHYTIKSTSIDQVESRQLVSSRIMKVTIKENELK